MRDAEPIGPPPAPWRRGRVLFQPCDERLRRHAGRFFLVPLIIPPDFFQTVLDALAAAPLVPPSPSRLAADGDATDEGEAVAQLLDDVFGGLPRQRMDGEGRVVGYGGDREDREPKGGRRRDQGESRREQPRQRSSWVDDICKRALR